MMRNTVILICVLLLSTTLACGKVDSPESTETTIPGWEKFEAGGVQLWLPESWEGGDLSGEVDVIAERVRGLGPDFEYVAQMIENNPSMWVLWAFDTEVGESGILTNVNISKERVLSAITIDAYMEAAIGQLPAQFQVIDNEVVALTDYDAGRLVIGSEIYGVACKQVMYAIKDGNTVWAIAFTTSAEEFDQRLPAFEQSADSFAIHL